MQLRQAARVILVGAPGVGKGTQSERLLKRFPQLSSISSGDLLRQNVRGQTALGKQVEALMKGGALVPDAMILRLIMGELVGKGWIVPPRGSSSTVYASPTSHESSNESGDSLDAYASYTASDLPWASYILDGFPRTAPQAQTLATFVPVNMVVQLQTPKEIILERIVNRRVHEPSGRVYNLTYNPPKEPGKDDITGEPLTVRADDSEEVWTKRLKSFDETSEPLLEHYDKMGVLWRVQGNSSNEITPKLFNEFETRFADG